MPANKATTNQRIAVLEQQAGIVPTKWGPFERSEVARLSATLPLVDVSVTEMRPMGYFTKQTEPVDAGYYSSVPTVELLDISSWFHSKASGGGKYLVELIDPDNPGFGAVLGFTVKVDGPSRKSPTLARQENVNRVDTALKTNQLAQTFIQSGMDPATAYETARKTLENNPLAAAALTGGVAAPQQEDEMEKLFRYAMMRDLMGKKEEKSSNGESAELKALRDQLKAMQDQLQEERRRADESRHQAELRELKQQMAMFAQKVREDRDSRDRDRGPDTASAITTALTGMFSSMNSQQQTQAASQAAILKEIMTSQTSGKSDMLNAVMGNMLNMMQLQVQQQQAKMQEPLQQVQVMGEMAKMTGGLLSAMVQMQKDMNGDDPAWLKIALDMMSELPEVIKSVSTPLRTREIHVQGRSPSGDELAVRREMEEMARLQQQADLALGDGEPRAAELPRKPTDPPPPPPSDGEEGSEGAEGAEETEVSEREIPEEGPWQTANRVVRSLGITVFLELLEHEAWIEYFYNLDRSDNADLLGQKFVETALWQESEIGEVPEGLEELVMNPRPLLLALERNLDWSVDRVREFAVGFAAYKEEYEVRKEDSEE